MIRLFAGGFPRDLEESELKEIFEQYGEVLEVKIVRDKKTAISRRFGFVDMATDEGADLAMAELHGGSIDDQEISVTKADNREKVKAKAPARKVTKITKGGNYNKAGSSYGKFGGGGGGGKRPYSGGGNNNNRYNKPSNGNGGSYGNSGGGAPQREKRPRLRRDS